MKTLRTLGLALLVGLTVVGAVAATNDTALAAVVSVPSVSTVGPNGDVVVPITVDPATGVLSMQFAIGYDPAVLTPTGVYKTDFADSFDLFFNVPSPGDLRITMFGVTPLSGSGEVAWIVFRAVGANGTSSSLVFNQAELNEGNIASTPQNGSVNVTAATSVISMPDDANGENGTNVSIPVTATPSDGFISVDLDVRWNPLILNATSVSAGSLPNDWVVLSNLTTPGRAQVSLYGVTPTSGTIPLVNIHYDVTGSYGEQTPLDITRGDANEGNITTSLDDGLFTVSCDDGNPCTDDSFNGSSCVHTNTPMGTACNSASNTDCDNPDTCDGAGSCQPNNEPNGTSCTTDGNDCTLDACNTGTCAHTNEPSGTSCGSPTNTDCDNPDTCNGTGSCQTNYEPMGTGCTSDGNTCTTDACNGGGTCNHTTLPDGTVCSDGNPCTQTDLCSSGTCVGSNPVIVPEINDSVRLTHSGLVTTITWNDPPGAYDVYRGSRRNGIPWSYNQVCFDGPTQESSSVDAVRPLAGVAFYYLVARRTQCGESILGRNSNNVPIPNTHPCDYPDFDNDGVQDKFDNCPVTPNSGQEDADGDALGDVCDNCPGVFNPDQQDSDNDGTGNACEPPIQDGLGGAGIQTEPGMNGAASTIVVAGTSDTRAAVPARVRPETVRVFGSCAVSGAAVQSAHDARSTASYTLDGGA